MIDNTDLRAYYNTVGCQTISPDGRYLVAGNIYGDISIFELVDYNYTILAKQSLSMFLLLVFPWFLGRNNPRKVLGQVLLLPLKPIKILK